MTAQSSLHLKGPAARLFPTIQFTEAAEGLAQTIAESSNQFRANSATGNEYDLEGYIRADLLDVFTSAHTRSAVKLIEEEARRAGLDPGACVQVTLAAGPVSPDRARNAPITFATGIYDIGADGIARNVSGISSINSLSNNFDDVAEIEEKGLLAAMKAVGQSQIATVYELPASVCSNLKR